MGTVPLHSHFPCEGTPEHEGSCTEPKLKLVSADAPGQREVPSHPAVGAAELLEVRRGLEESQDFFRESLLRAFGASSENNRESTAPPPAKSGVFAALELAEDDEDDDPYFRRKSGAV